MALFIMPIDRNGVKDLWIIKSFESIGAQFFNTCILIFWVANV